jgi:tetratricopeptide (TPR) repeat protein
MEKESDFNKGGKRPVPPRERSEAAVPGLTELVHVTVLVGAEVAAEAGLPTVDELAGELIDALVGPRWAATELKRMTRASRPDAEGGRDGLRGELVLLWVADVFDENLAFADFIDEARTPMASHRRLAAAAVQGARVLTTNVDDLLEQAVVDLGGTAHTVDVHAADLTRTGGSVAVVKLRGTRQAHAGGDRRPAGTARMTIDAIGAGGPASPANQRVEEHLTTALAGRDLVVCGLTATDELDVLPVLGGSRPRSVVWIDPCDGPLEVGRPSPPGDGASAAARMAWAWHEAAVGITVVKGPMTEALDVLGMPQADTADVDTANVDTAEVDRMAAGPPWRERVRAWAQEVRDEDPTGLGLATLLFAEVGRYSSAERALEESEPSPRPGAGWSRARCLYERAQMALLRPLGDPEVAHRLGAEALAAAQADPGAGMELNCHMVLGRAAFALRRWDEALQQFETALARSPDGSHDRGLAASWIGRTRLWRNDPLGARPPLRQAILLLRLVGEMEGLVDALQALGIAESTLGRHARAVPLFAEARDIAGSLGFPDQHFAAVQALADCMFARGAIAAARDELTAIVANEATAQCDEVTLAWSLLAAVELESGNLDAAREAAMQGLGTRTVWTRDETAGIWALLAEVEWLDGRRDAALRAAEQALEQPDDHATWWGRARAEAVLAALSGDPDSLARALAPQVSLLSGPPLLIAAGSLHQLGIDTAQSRRLRERARRYARRIGADHWA